MCASPLFLLIVASFGDFADFAPPLTSVWRTLLWHVTPFCALLLHVTEILRYMYLHTTCYLFVISVTRRWQWQRNGGGGAATALSARRRQQGGGCRDSAAAALVQWWRAARRPRRWQWQRNGGGSAATALSARRRR
jgi:hypothetical protein